MKKLITTVLCLACLISLFSCGKNSKKDELKDDTIPESTVPDTTLSDTTEPDSTTGDTSEETTEAPYEPIYEDDGFTYKIDIRSYLPYINPKSPSEYLIIANRKHPLGEGYTPKNLTKIDGGSKLLCNTARLAFEAMRLEMQELGVYDTRHQSTYRSYSYQKDLYQKYIDRERQKYPHLSLESLMAIVDTYSARAGTSDHQTGLTIDFNPINSSFSGTKAFKYLKENAHKFGFIMRYPEGKSNITGYKYEPWHWRFVGRDAATYIYEHGITLEEYMAEINGTAVETFPETTPIPPATSPQITEETTAEATTVEETKVEETTTVLATDPPETSPEQTTGGETSAETSSEQTTPEQTTQEESTTEEITKEDTTSEQENGEPASSGNSDATTDQ